MNNINFLAKFDVDLTSKESVFDYIEKILLEKKLLKQSNKLIVSFKDREKEGSTGFENGIAIPHAKINSITKPIVFVIKTKNGIEWESLDGKLINKIIALIIPENSNKEHLELLSSISKKLLKDSFLESFQNINNENDLKSIFFENEEKILLKEQNGKKMNIVAVTACVVGVAHTYLAEERLLDKLSKAGYNIRVETQGSKGFGNELTSKEIERADLVIIASDTNVDKSRFFGKKLYQCKVANAVKDPLKLLDDALENAYVYNSDKNEFNNKKKSLNENQSILKHILAGISYMIPIVILGGICLAASLGIAKAIWGPTAGTAGPTNTEYPYNPLAIMEKIGAVAFTLMIPVLAAFIANSIGGRAAIAPALVGGFIGNNADFFVPLPGMPSVITPMGFIGSIIAGLLVGYFTKWVNTWNVPKSLKAAMPIFFIPIIGGIGISVIFMYVLGGPIGWIMQQFSTGIKNAYSSEKIGLGIGLGLGIVLGAMASFDMGGPINKIGFVTSVALLDSQIAEPMGALAAGIPVAPLGMGLTSIIFKRFFDEQERQMGASAIVMGMIGISEGAIPFAIRDPKRAITCNVIGGALAGGIAGAFRVQDNAGHGGPIVAFLGAVPYGEQTAIFLIAIACGTLLTVLTYGFWLVYEKGTIGSLKEHYVLTIENEQSIYKENIKVLKQNKAIEDNKSKILDLKNDFKNKKNNLKKHFKEIESLDKINFKKNKTMYKNQINDLFEERNKMLKIVNDKYKGMENNKNNKNLYKNEINLIKSDYCEKLINLKKSFHSNFILKFDNKLNIL